MQQLNTDLLSLVGLGQQLDCMFLHHEKTKHQHQKCKGAVANQDWRRMQASADERQPWCRRQSNETQHLLSHVKMLYG